MPDGRVFIIGDYSTLDATMAELYDPVADRWTLAAVSPAKYGTAGAALDPTSDRWTTVAPLPVARSGHTATLLPDGRVLVVGGVGDHGDTRPANAAALYDPKADQWSDAGTTMMTTGGHTATRLPDGSVLVMGRNDLVNTQNQPIPNADRYIASILPTSRFPRVSIVGTLLIVGRESCVWPDSSSANDA